MNANPLWAGLLLILTAVSADREAAIMQQLFEKSGYNAYLRPGSDDGETTNITVNMFVRRFNDIDIKNMVMSVTITLRQEWQDPRLQYTFPGNPYIRLPRTDMVWKPDTFIRNEVEAKTHSVMQENSYVRVAPDGTVTYSVRLTLTLSCPMNLRNFPFDTQTCCLMLASYGEQSKTVNYIWKEKDPISVANPLYVKSYVLTVYSETGGVHADKCDAITSTGNYSCVSAAFRLSRAYSHTVATVMIPAIMWVTVSWVAFWLRRESVLPRLVMATLSLYSLSTKAAELNSTLPEVSYTKALDTWTGVCILFAFLALVEVVIVNFIGDPDKKEDPKKQEAFLETIKNVLQNFKISGAGAKLDFISRILFPVAFFIFATAYFATFTNLDEENEAWGPCSP